MKRRHFTKSIGAGLLGAYASPMFGSMRFQPNTAMKVPVGLCNHSLRSMRLNAQQLIAYAIEHNLDSVLFNTLQPFENLEASYLTDLRRLAQSADISIYVGAGSISEKSTGFSDKYGTAEELLKEGIRVAGLVGSPIVGCRIGSIEDRYAEGGIEAHIEGVIRVMKSLRQQALDAGIKFAFENHAGDLRSGELLKLIEETGTDICGALFDPANAVWAMEDPMVAFDRLGPAIISTSVRDIQVWETKDGAAFQGTAVGDGLLDLRRYAKAMAERNPGIPMHIETISNSARPVPFLNPEFWKGFPNLRAHEMVDFLKLIKKGNPLEIITPPSGVTLKKFEIDLQQSEFLKSVSYLRANCNVGLKSGEY